MTIDEAIDGLSFAKKWQHRDANMPPTPPHPPQTMVLELHVWGPAFGLPSIDSECIAAVAYAQLTLREGTWVVVASHDVDKSPNSARLPCPAQWSHLGSWLQAHRAVPAKTQCLRA